MIELYPHQKEALPKIKNGSILWGGVGSGKSLTAVAYYLKDHASRKANIYVITTAKKRDSLDWEKEFARAAIGTTPESTISGVLTVDSWNNIGKYRDVQDAFFIFDEQRLVGAGSWTSFFIGLAKKNAWILLSATPGDTWLDYIPVFIANGFYKNRTEFKREHVVYNTFTKFPKVDHYVNVGRLVKHRNNILVHMPYRRHTTRHSIIVPVEYDKELYEKVAKDRWHVYEERPCRDVAELFSVMRKVANTDSSRMNAVTSLMVEHPRMIVFYNFDYELELLRNLISLTNSSENGLQIPNSSTLLLDSTSDYIWSPTSKPKSTLPLPIEMPMKDGSDRPSESSTASKKMHPVSVSEWNGHLHQPIPKTDRWVYLVQYQAGAEGWNCIETDTTVFWSLPYSFKIWEQAHGRIDRLNTPFFDLHYHIFMSNSSIDQIIYKTLMRKRSFNESAYMRTKGGIMV